MGRRSWRDRTTLLRTWVAPYPMDPQQQGGPHARYTRLRPARPLLVRPGLLPPHLSTLPGPDHRDCPHHRPPHHLQPPPHRRRTGPRAPLELSPRPVPPPLVVPRVGADPYPVHPRSLGPGGARLLGGRRHRRRAPRRPGLRQGVPSRPGALDPFLHRLPLGAQMGRSDYPGALPLRQEALGVAGARGAVSQPGEGPEGQGRGPEGPAPQGQGPDQGQGQGAGPPPSRGPAGPRGPSRPRS